jgi:BASS family bile acid:Na+ symporter
MDLKQVVMLAFQISILATVFGFGLKATTADLLYLVQRPGLLVRSLLAVFVIMPSVALMLTRWFNFLPTVEIALVALAISPVPPILPGREAKAGGQASYGLALMVLLGLASIAIVPLGADLVGPVFGQSVEMGPRVIAGVVLKAAVLPLVAGMIVRAVSPAVAEAIAKPVSLAANVLMSLAAVALLVGAAPAMWALIGNGTLLAMLIFLTVGYGVGHVLGGPDPDHSAVLALSTACRHPAIALSIAATNFPDQHFGAAILLNLILGILLGIPYTAWQKRQVATRASLPL